MERVASWLESGADGRTSWREALPTLLGLGLVVGWTYAVPTLVALERDHPRLRAIVWCNLLAGWTGVGWLAALAWALSGPRGAKAPEIKGLDDPPL